MSKIALLVSGGMDSCILASTLLKAGQIISPIYIRHGLIWEQAEEHHLKLYLSCINSANLKPLTIIEQPVNDIYEQHWSVSGNDVPDQNTDDSAVYLPGRNLLLLTKVGVWCALNHIDTIALGTLQGNPFSDNTEEFYQCVAKSISIATETEINIIRPFANKSKDEILVGASNLPLHLTFSCIQPQDNKHCGKCNKCAERKKAYLDLDIKDLTSYAQ